MTRLQWLIAAATVMAAIAAATSLILLLRGPAPPPAYAAGVPSAPPLAVPSAPASGSGSASPSSPSNSVTVRLVMPEVGIDIAVIPGDGVSIPLHFAMHYPGTAWPGQRSNSLFYAHAQPGMFLGLYRLHLGDQIRVIRADGSELTYRVTAFERVPYDDRKVLDPTPFDQITLLTCTSYDPYTPRFIVIATLE